MTDSSGPSLCGRLHHAYVLSGRFLELDGGPAAFKNTQEKRSRDDSGLTALWKRALPDVHAIADLLRFLTHSTSWLFVNDYRNAFVHVQRRRLEGLGITFARRERWQESMDEKGQRIRTLNGGGDPPDLTLQEMFERTDEGYRLLWALVDACCAEVERWDQRRRVGLKLCAFSVCDSA